MEKELQHVFLLTFTFESVRHVKYSGVFLLG